MALAARKTQKSVAVDRQPKKEGDEMIRVHKSTNMDDAFAANAELNILKKHFDCNKTSGEIFSLKKYLLNLEF